MASIFIHSRKQLQPWMFQQTWAVGILFIFHIISTMNFKFLYWTKILFSWITNVNMVDSLKPAVYVLEPPVHESAFDKPKPNWPTGLVLRFFSFTNHENHAYSPKSNSTTTRLDFPLIWLLHLLHIFLFKKKNYANLK